ncbi:3-oxoacyl-ACP synthase [candidate division KSB3 bacterium]|uniref:Beta-ketoacyl-[acyl-carrier-protein] synthase III n=1 Tax=candidate division KSB3 bacterium TaxID=2044937 RepID=A0A2G6KC52_9BACT|nr:MAG: 3-oxoacyl-ACP synthase [candidate division KSB3 bacterium]
MFRSKIIGTGAYVPDKIVTNTDLEAMVNTSDKWIRERTGIKERRIAHEDVPVSHLAFGAAERALKDAMVDPLDIDLIVLGTVTPDMPMPSTACLVQHKLGAVRAVAFDVSAACSGFLYALTIGDQFIRTGMYKRILVIGADMFSKVVDWTNRDTCILFSDGAGAVILEATDPEDEEHVVKSTHIFSDGRQSDTLFIPGGGSLNPASHDTLHEGMHYVRMRGNELFKLAVKSMVQAGKIALEHNNLEVSDLDLVVPHQANIRIMEAIAKKLKFPMEKVMVTIDYYGNSSAATVPIAFDKAHRDGKLKDGDTVLAVAFGAGLTWGSALIQW